MKMTFAKRVMLAAFGLTALGFAGSAQAQTEAVTATVVVQNTLTTNVVDNMNFGTVAAISDAAQTATLVLNPVTDALTTATGGGTAVFAVIDNTNVAGANLTIEDAAGGATINVEIDNVVNPTFGGATFTLGTFTTSWNGAAAAARIIGTPWTQTFNAGFGGGVNTLDIGATLTTATGATYTDGTYPGSFEVSFSY